MDLTRLEKYKTKFKAFGPKINSLQSYLSRIDGNNELQKILIPDAIAQQLHIPAMDVIFVLGLAEKEKIVHKAYKIWTIDDQYYLGEFPNTDLIPERIYNAETGREVDSDQFYASLVFEVNG